MSRKDLVNPCIVIFGSIVITTSFIDDAEPQPEQLQRVFRPNGTGSSGSIRQHHFISFSLEINLSSS